MDYTPERQRADIDFLVGVNFGREQERERIATDLLAKNIRKHGHKCLCLVCTAFAEAASIARQS